MPRGKTNAGNSNSKSASRFAAAVRIRRERTNLPVDATTVGANTNADNIVDTTVNNEIGSDRSETVGNEPDVTIVGGRNRRDGRTGRTGSGSNGDSDTRTRTDNRSDGDSDGDGERARVSAQSDIRVKKERKKRITIAERAEQLANELGIDEDEAEQRIREERKQNRKPRKVTSLDGDVEPGVTASVLLIGSLIEGGSELIAMAANKPYLQLEKQEARNLSEAWMQVLDTFPKSVRKNFDRIFAKYYPWWNLAKVATAIAYPRWIMYQAERDFVNAQATSTTTQ